MTRPLRLSALLFACLLTAVGAGVAHAADDTDSSENLRAQAKSIRKAAEAGFAQRESGCYDRFQVNACLDAAHEDRTAQMQTARKLEARANRIDRGERIKAMEARLKEAEARRAKPTPVPLLPLPGNQ